MTNVAVGKRIHINTVILKLLSDFLYVSKELFSSRLKNTRIFYITEKKNVIQ